jgi:hypothetical protein
MTYSNPRIALIGVYLVAVATLYFDLFVWRQAPPICYLPPVKIEERSCSANQPRNYVNASIINRRKLADMLSAN